MSILNNKPRSAGAVCRGCQDPGDRSQDFSSNDSVDKVEIAAAGKEALRPVQERTSRSNTVLAYTNRRVGALPLQAR